MKELRDILARKTEIKARAAAADVTADELTKLETEMDQLDKDEIEARKAGLQGRSRELPKPEERKAAEPDDIRDNPQYRTAWLKNLQGKPLTEEEKRAYTISSDSSGGAVPNPTSDMLFTKMTKQAPMLSEITLLRVAGNVSFTTEGQRDAAAQHTENAAITAATDTLIKVSLTGYEFNKLLYISKAVQTMSVNAFEGWLTDMIAEDIAVAIENAIINGNGSTAPKGVLYAATWATTTNLVVCTGTYVITYSDILSMFGKLAARYQRNAKFLADNAMVYQGLAAIKDSNGRPILVNDATGEYPFRILGKPVIVSDKMPTKTLFLGDFKKIVGNLAQDVTVERDASAGFASNSIAYRGGAIFDCTVSLSDAFVKLTTATY